MLSAEAAGQQRGGKRGPPPAGELPSVNLQAVWEGLQRGAGSQLSSYNLTFPDGGWAAGRRCSICVMTPPHERAFNQLELDPLSGAP